MNITDKTREELLSELQELRREHDALRKLYEKIRIEVRLDEDMLLKLLKAVNTNSDAIFLTNTDGIITYINSGFTALYGYTADEVVGKVTPRILKSGLLGKEVYEGFWGTLKNKNEVKGEILNRKKSGETVYIEGTASPILDEHNAIIGFLGIQRDNTERKKIEATLRASEQKFNDIVSNLDEGFYSCTLDGVLLDCNTAFKRIFGYESDQDIRGVNVPDLWQYPEIRNKYVEKLKDDGFIRSYLMDSKTIKGEKTVVLVNSHMVKDENDRMVRIEGTLTDFTERKRIEEEINHKNEELVRLNSEKDKFFSIIAHDLRSPFNTFLGFTRIMAEELPMLTLEEINKMAQSMKKSANNLFNLLENLLEWSQIQRDGIIFNPESFILISKLSEVLEVIVDIAGKKGIKVSYDIPESMLIFADVHMFGTVIRNLVSNAVKFTPRKGKIIVKAKSLIGSWVEIAVKDTGIGMNEEMTGNLFRLDKNTKRTGTEKEPTTGLGLIICKEFIEKHGGSIWVESEEGNGSIFHFTIPQPAGK